jgi:hypothetical protein
MIAIVPLIVLGLVVAGVVALTRRRGDSLHVGAAGGGEGELRRLFLYGVLFIALALTATGAYGLLRLVLAGARPAVGSDAADLARNLAFVIVAAPVYALLWRWIRPRLADPEERASFAWAAFMAAVQLLALVAAATGLAELLAVLFGAGRGWVDPTSQLVVAAAVWAWHWWLFGREGVRPSTGRDLTLLGGSAFGLIALSVAVGAVLSSLAGSAYERLFSETVVGGTTEALRRGLAWAVTGGIVWSWYWLRHGRGLQRTRLWHAYTLLLGVLAPLVTLLAAAGTLLALVLVWLLGNTFGDTAVSWFRPVPGTLVTGGVALAVWAYHRTLIGTDPGVFRTEPGRIYRYLMAGAGLAAASIGIGAIVSAAIQALQPATAGEGPINTLLYGVTAIAVGGPVWWGSWRKAQAATKADPEAELRSPSRRSYLVLWVGVVGVVALIALIVTVYQFVEGALESRSLLSILDSARGAIGTLVAAGAVGAFHLAVWRSDRAAAPAEAPRRIRHVLLVGGEDADRVAAQIREQTGAHVAVWHRLDDGEVTLDAESVIARLSELDEPRVLVVAEPGGPEVVPYRV